MIIDAHSHGLNGKYLDKLSDMGGEWSKRRIANEQAVAKELPQALDVAFRIAQLSKYGFDYQIVTPRQSMDVNVFPGDNAAKTAFAAAVNDNMARLQEDGKGKLIAIGTISLLGLEMGGLKEMERATKELGLRGFSITSHALGKPIDSQEFEAFWTLVEQLDVPVYIHPKNPVNMQDRAYEAEYDLAHNFGWPFETVLALSRLVFSEVMERHPKLKVISHHLGGGMVPLFLGPHH